MDFLKRNSGKLALLAIIVFFTLPFIYGNEEEDEDFSPFAVKSGMSYQANPISKLANRIASFYGFPKPANEMVASNSLMDPVKGKVADHHIFSKESTSNPDYKAELGSNSDFKDAANSRRNHRAANNKNSNSIKDEVLMASAQRYKNFGTDYNGASSSVPGYAGQASSASYTSLPATSATRTNNPIKGTVKINGQKYNVIEDAKGERYVVTPRGHIPYKEVVRRSFSEKEFLATKKRLGNVSDMEVLQELQRERAQREGSNGSSSYHQQNAEGYRHGTASSVGGNSYASVSTGDKGFDDDLLSNAYADLKSISLGIGTPSSSSSGGSYSGGSSYGGALRDSYGGSSSGAGSEEQAEQEDVFNPSAIARDARTQTQQYVSAQNTQRPGIKPEGQQLNEEEQQPQEQPESEVAVTQNGPKVIMLKRNDNDDGYIPTKQGDEGNSSVLFLEGEPYTSTWGISLTQIKISNKERTGILMPVQVTDIGDLTSVSDEAEIKERIYRLNEHIGNIRNLIANIPEGYRVYIGKNDEVSDNIINKIFKKSVEDNDIQIVEDKSQADIVLSDTIFTLESFANLEKTLEQLPEPEENANALS